MSASFCNVALPVPLRNTFTYSIPEALRAQVQPGSRVLVPFRKKSLVGVRSEEHTPELQSPDHLVCRLLLEKKKKTNVALDTMLTCLVYIHYICSTCLLRVI